MTRVNAFVLACILGIVAIAIYIGVTARRQAVATSLHPRAPIHAEQITAAPDTPFLMFRNATPGDLFGRVALVRLPVASGETDTRFVTPLSCERVFYAAGTGLCLVSDETKLPVRYSGFTFDRTFATRHTFPLTGPPIRARVSADGRRAAFTVFERGHSYADESFSTRTTILDIPSGQSLGDLEQFTVRKDGQPFKAVDFNFWGLTFASDANHFYATLRSGGQRYLVSGAIDAREMTVVRADVECPSLSPDGRRIVYKHPLKGVMEVGWRLYVLDVASGEEHPLNQVSRSVDDQVDWFDNDHIVYHDSAPAGTGIWLLAIDDAAPPWLLLPDAYSPAVTR
jgi:hypothetical protein